MFPYANPALVTLKKGGPIIPPGDTDGFVTLGLSGSPFIQMFARSGSDFTSLGSLPDSLSAASFSQSFHPDGDLLAVTIQSSPYLKLYNVSAEGVLTASDVVIGTNPTIPLNNIKWSPDGNYLACVGNGTPWIICYRFDKVARTLTRLANPATLPGSAMRACDWSGASDRIVIVGSGTSAQSMRLYEVSGTTITHRSHNSNQQQVYDVSMSGDRIVAAWGTASPWVRHYILDGTRLLLTYLTAGGQFPTPAAGAQHVSADWNDDGETMLLAANTSINVQRWNGTSWDTAVAQLISRVITKARWISPDLILIGTSSAPFIELWQWTGSALVKLSTPPVLLGSGYPMDFAVSPLL